LLSNLIEKRTSRRFDPRLLTAPQLRAARALAELSADALAKQAGLSKVTVWRAEAKLEAATLATRHALVDALEAAGVHFIGPDEGGPGVRRPGAS
jgi:hypothetical protein